VTGLASLAAKALSTDRYMGDVQRLASCGGGVSLNVELSERTEEKSGSLLKYTY
jgi:hypothetical protein